MSKKKDEQTKPQETAVSAAEEMQETAAEEAAAAEETKQKAEKKPKKARTSEEEANRALNRVKRRKKLKYGTLATVITVVFIAIIVLVNVICNVLDNRHDWNIDLTSTGLYQIDDQTVEYLNRLNTDVDILVLAEESYFDNYSQLKVVQETLNRFKAESNGHISLDYVDITAHPEAVSKYQQNYSGEFEEADIIVASGDLVRVIPFDDMVSAEQSIDYSTYSYVYNYTFVGEKSLISAIMGVTDLNPISVAVINYTNGAAIYNQYDGANFDKLLELLDKNNYNVEETDIALNDIPADCEIAILCAPSTDLTEAQIDKLTNFLYNDGQYNRQLIYFASPFQQAMPNLDAFLEVWGIEIGSGVIRESNESAAQYAQLAYIGMQSGIPAAVLTDSELNASVVSSKLPIIAPLSRPVNQLFTSNSGRTTEALLTTSDTAVLQIVSSSGEGEEAESTSTYSDPAVFNVAVYATQNFVVNNEEQTSGIVAFGSAWFLDYYVASSASYDNANYFVTLLNTMTGKENVFVVAEKSLNQTAITITDSQAKTIRNVVVWFIPLAVAVIGIVVYVRRRNK